MPSVPRIGASWLTCTMAMLVACGNSVTAQTAAQEHCEKIPYLSQQFTACSFALNDYRIEVRNRDSTGQPLRSFERLQAFYRKRNTPIVLAMNGGMYHKDLGPVGLLIEDGQRKKKLNMSWGFGNFYLKPNGVFAIQGNRAFVLESNAYRKAEIDADFATQSGPMLLIAGKIHHRFLPDATSRNIRNGVGVSIDGRTVTFVITETETTFYEFARFFKDKLGIADALYLDGSISRLFAPESGRSDPGEDMGPIIAVTPRTD